MNKKIALVLDIIIFTILNSILYFTLNLHISEAWFPWAAVLFVFNLIMISATMAGGEY